MTLDLAGLRLYYETVSQVHPLSADIGLTITDIGGGDGLVSLQAK